MKINCILVILVLFYSCKSDMSSHLSANPVTTAQLFLPGIVTLEDQSEFSLAISPVDAKTIFFVRRKADDKQKIYETHYVNGEWSTPKVASFSTDRDESPNFSTDGKTVYFGSERPIPNRPNKGNFDMNVWKSEFVNNEWSSPTPLSEVVNAVQEEGEEWPSSNVSHFVTVDDKTFYTGTQVRGDKGLDIFKTNFDGKDFSTLQKLPNTINSDNKWEYAPVVTYDGQYLFFQVYQPEGGFGGDDILVSKKGAKGNWLPAKNVGPLLNTNMNECPLTITADGKYFFVQRDKKDNPDDYDGIASVYFIEMKALNLHKLFE